MNLSICVPTYNRAKYLPTMLDSIFNQAMSGVEVVVCNNNSTDDTEQIVKRYQKKYKNLVYFKNDQNIGFDRNMLRVVSLATSEYCWVIGDDDAMLPGSIGHILQALKSGHAFYAVGLELCDARMRRLQYWDYLKNIEDGSVFNMGSRASMLDYLSSVRGNAGLFGYIGTMVFKRDLWLRVKGYERVLGLGWIHVYMMWYLKDYHCAFKYLARPVIALRTQNDPTTQQKSFVARLTMEFKGLLITADEIFKEDTQMRAAFLKAVTQYINPCAIPPIFMLRGQAKKDWPELVKYINKYPYSDKFKRSINSPLRFNLVYFLRDVLNRPAMRYIKRPFKFIKDKCCS